MRFISLTSIDGSLICVDAEAVKIVEPAVVLLDNGGAVVPAPVLVLHLGNGMGVRVSNSLEHIELELGLPAGWAVAAQAAIDQKLEAAKSQAAMATAQKAGVVAAQIQHPAHGNGLRLRG